MSAPRLSRRAALSAAAVAPIALSVQPSRAADAGQWEVALQRFRMCEAMKDADEYFGDLAEAGRAHDEHKRQRVRRFGPEGKTQTMPEAMAAREEAWAAMTAAEDAHYKNFIVPIDKAAIALALTPAPNLDALLIKIDIIKRFELDNTKFMPRDPMEIVREDFARLERRIDHS